MYVFICMKHLLNISKGLYVVPGLGQKYIVYYNTTRSPVQVGKLRFVKFVQFEVVLHIILGYMLIKDTSVRKEL